MSKFRREARMARIALVTGGSGFVGGHLSERLVDNGWTVRVLDLRRPALERPVDWIDADVRDKEAMTRAAAGVEVIFHLGAVVGVDRAIQDPVESIDVTVTGTLCALEAAAARGASLVHLSSSEVLGMNTDLPWTEESNRVLGSALTDRWSYGSAKAAAEHLVLAGAPLRSVAATVIRPFNVYGPRQERRFVVPLMLDAALSGSAVRVHGDGTQTRSFTYVDDVVSGIVAAGNKPGVGPLFHLGSTDEVSIMSLAKLIVDKSASSSPVCLEDPSVTWGERFEDIGRRLPDASQAQSLLGWTATTSLERGLDRTIEWARSTGW
ncbi:MAG: NAD-dependent epimerase/dehydratase family protein [Microthrixaceae bacterium]